MTDRSLPAPSTTPSLIAGILTALGAVAAISATAIYGIAAVLLITATLPLPLVALWTVAGDNGR